MLQEDEALCLSFVAGSGTIWRAVVQCRKEGKMGARCTQDR